jgi:DNA-binding transcriptional LysR family regulator
MIEEPSWDFYRTFLTVLRHGSLSAAARELGLTQPTVGRHIDALEQAVGTQLFTRSQSGLLPTEAARALAPFAETMASSSSALLRAASGHRDRIEGTVRISASEVIAVEVLPPILASLQDRHPALEIELSASDDVEDLLNREADIAVRMMEPQQDALVVRRIGDIPIACYAHRAYLARHGTPETLEDIRDHRLIGFDRQTAYVRTMVQRFPAAGGIAFAFRTDSYLAQLAAIRSGCGIGMCQTGLGDADPNLVRVLPGIMDMHIGTWVAMHENLKTSPRCRAAFDALVDGLKIYLDNCVSTRA